MERQRIPLYKVRQFGEKINDTFSFVSENFKPLFKYVTYFMLPLALLMALAMNGYMDGVLQTARNPDAMSADAIANFAVGYGGIILLSLLMGIILPALIYAMMRIYSERENGLKNLTWQELKPTMMHLLKRNTKLMLAFLFFGLLLFAVFGVLVALRYDLHWGFEEGIPPGHAHMVGHLWRDVGALHYYWYRIRCHFHALVYRNHGEDFLWA